MSRHTQHQPQRLNVALDLHGCETLVVGGGEVAERKVRGLLAAGASVTVVAPRLNDWLTQQAEVQSLVWHPRPYAPGDLTGCRLAVAATDLPDVNAQVAAEARDAGVFCNVAAPPDAGDCWFLAGFERGPLSVALGTAGASPFAARKLRQLLEETLTPELGQLVSLLGELREQVQATLADEAQRRAAYERMWHGPALELLRAGEVEAARRALLDEIG